MTTGRAFSPMRDLPPELPRDIVVSADDTDPSVAGEHLFISNYWFQLTSMIQSLLHPPFATKVGISICSLSTQPV